MADGEVFEMHPEFASWYSSLGMEDNPERLKARWKGVRATADLGTFESIEPLVRIALRWKQVPSSDDVNAIQLAFKEADPTFDADVNSREMEVLAACALAELFEDNDEYSSVAALSVSTAHMLGARQFKLPMSLPGLAEQALVNLCRESSERPDFSKLAQNESPKVDLTVASKTVTDKQSWDGISEAFKQTADVVRAALATVTKRHNAHVSALQKILALQDEELQMLWWLVGQRSWDLNKSFADIPEVSRALVLSNELANCTSVLPGPLSITALLSRAGVTESAILTLPELIAANELDWLKRIAPPEPISQVTQPMHFAITRYLETDGGSTWIPPWSTISGISDSFKLNTLQWATLFYRERLLYLR